MATTNFEKLCASKPLALNNALFDESRAAKPCQSHGSPIEFPPGLRFAYRH